MEDFVNRFDATARRWEEQIPTPPYPFGVFVAILKITSRFIRLLPGPDACGICDEQFANTPQAERTRLPQCHHVFHYTCLMGFVEPGCAKDRRNYCSQCGVRLFAHTDPAQMVAVESVPIEPFREITRTKLRLRAQFQGQPQGNSYTQHQELAELARTIQEALVVMSTMRFMDRQLARFIPRILIAAVVNGLMMEKLSYHDMPIYEFVQYSYNRWSTANDSGIMPSEMRFFKAFQPSYTVPLTQVCEVDSRKRVRDLVVDEVDICRRVRRRRNVPFLGSIVLEPFYLGYTGADGKRTYTEALFESDRKIKNCTIVSFKPHGEGLLGGLLALKL